MLPIPSRIARSFVLACAIFSVVISTSLGQAPPAAASPPSQADPHRALVLKREIAADNLRREQLEKELDAQQTQYDTANRELVEHQSAVTALEKKLDALADGDAAKATLRAELTAKQKELALAQERFDLIFAERKATQTLLDLLAAKAQADQTALAGAQNTVPAASTEKKSPTPAAPGVPIPLLDTDKSAAAEKKESISERVAAAENEADRRKQAADQARQSVADLQQRQQTLSATIDLERERLAAAAARHDNLSQTLRTQEQELFRQLDAGAEFSSLGELSAALDKTREETQIARQAIQDGGQRIETLRLQLAALQREEVDLAREAQQKSAAAIDAARRKWLVTITDYLVVVLPKVALIGIAIAVFHWLLRRFSGRMTAVFASRGRGTEAERENHAKTLMGVFENAAATAIYIAGALAILDTLHVPIGTLLGGVAVVGLAVAFGAQNLIRDYFYGFMILLENQYKIGDVITVNGNTGSVERITLRITVLRDFEGKVYFIPHGEIKSVINQTHEWSRVVLDIGVGYQEKIERVLSVLLELAEAIHREPAFQGAFLQEPELMGVERLSDSAVVIRLCFVTHPNKKGAIQREMLRRIKNRFDELNIEIPYPQRTIHWLPPASPAGSETAPPFAATVPSNGHPDAPADAG